MRTKLPLLLCAFLFVALTASASLAGVWQFPLDQSWTIDPEFQFGSPYGGEVHLGEDVEAPAGTPVHAAANGTVVLTANFPGYHDWGGLMLLEHKNVTGSTVVSLYGHLDARTFAVRPGQVVNRGQTLGKVGDSNHNGHWKTHLHFAVRKGGFVRSPWVYWGFASRATLGKWEAAHLYVPAHAGLKDVARVPINGRNRYETAAAASQWQFPGAGSVSDVVLASGERFEDALSATVLARELDAPLLLTRAIGLPSETQKELTRVLANGGTVTIVGGPASVSHSVITAIQALGFSVTRLSGVNAAATSVAVAEALPPSDTVFVVSTRSFADGLSAGVPAAMQGAPILLTDTATLSPEAEQFLQANPSQHVRIVGGSAVVSDAVSLQLSGLIASDGTLERIAGYDRYATNRFVAERFVSHPEVLVTATGQKFADALVGSVLAEQQNGMLLLSASNGLRAQVQDYVATVAPGVNVALVLGGQAVLTQAVDQKLGMLLNPGFVGASIPTNSSAQNLLPHAHVQPDWSAVPMQTKLGLTLPVPQGYRTTLEQVGPYQSVVLYDSPEEHALDVLLVAQVSSSGDPVTEISNWLGVPTSAVTPEGTGYHVAHGFVERHVVLVEQGGTRLLVALTGNLDQVLIDRLEQLNTPS